MQDIKEKETDFYQVLGLDQDASNDKIYEQYLKLSLKYHPDKGGDEIKYRMVNLAYQVLKDPENRKKYNAALATTFNQFKEEGRDTEYHLNQEFLTRDPERGNRTVFDLEKFLADFENKRGQQKETAEINPKDVKVPDKRLEDILASRLASRDQELNCFLSTQKTALFDPKTHGEEFNYVFNQYKSLHTKELEEVEDEVGIDGVDGVAKINFNYTDPEENRERISQLTSGFQDNYYGKSTPIVTSEHKADTSLLEKAVEQHRAEQKALHSAEQVRFKYTLDDSDKPMM